MTKSARNFWIHEQEKLVLKELGDVIDRYRVFFSFFEPVCASSLRKTQENTEISVLLIRLFSFRT